MKISQQFAKLLSGHYFQTEIFKGHNSLKNVGRVMVLYLCTSSYDALYLVYICTKFRENILVGIKVIEQTADTILMMVYICTTFHENILQGVKVIEQTQFSKEKFQRGIIP